MRLKTVAHGFRPCHRQIGVPANQTSTMADQKEDFTYDPTKVGQIISGKKIAKAVRQELKAEIAELVEKHGAHVGNAHGDDGAVCFMGVWFAQVSHQSCQ